MAVTSIWKVEGRLARVLGYAGNPDKAEGSPDEWELQGVGAAILYAADPGKTERQLYVTGVNCLPATALEEMNANRERIVENGAAKNRPARANKSPKDLSDDEVDEIIERVRKGEKVTF